MVAAVPGVLPVRDAAWVDVPPAGVLGGGGLHPAGSAPPQHDSPGPGQTAASRYIVKFPLLKLFLQQIWKFSSKMFRAFCVRTHNTLALIKNWFGLDS